MTRQIRGVLAEGNAQNKAREVHGARRSLTCHSFCFGPYALFMFLGRLSHAWASARALWAKSSTSRAARCSAVESAAAAVAVTVAVALKRASIRAFGAQEPRWKEGEREGERGGRGKHTR